MSRPCRTLLAWSSGKDSVWTLRALRDDPAIATVGLVTTVNAEFDRVAMHAVRRTLLEAQAAAVGLALYTVEIPYPCSNEEYAAAMGAFVERAFADGVEAMAFGALFLADVRAYREVRLAGTGIEPLFPLWGEETARLARRMIGAGLRATITCIDPKALDASFAGRAFDTAVLADLPKGADPCGENGEFHSFVTDGPMFAHPVAVARGEVVERDGFVFADLLPG